MEVARALYREKNEYLNQFYEEVPPLDFYREIFPIGSFERAGHQEDEKANGVLRDLSGERPKTYIVTDELQAIEKLQGCPMAVMSCVSYCGNTNKAVNARWLYAMIIDIDYLTKMTYIRALLNEIEGEIIPKPTFLVNSGNGVHLYYVFEKPVPMYRQLQVSVRELKYQLIDRVWNRYTSAKGEREDKQRQGIMQGFRIVGSQSKLGAACPVRAFRTGGKVTMEYLNGFVEKEYRVESFAYKSELSLAAAKKKYPEWYDRRIVRGEKRGSWTVKRDLYDWWLRKISDSATVGHRYYCMMCLAIYAKKCGISYEELEKDAYSLLEPFNAMGDRNTNPFTKIDIEDALGLYREPYETYPRQEVERVSGISIPPNKRNGRKQELHLERARAVQAIDYPNGEWRNKDGRPSAAQTVREWRKEHPEGKKADCRRDTKLDPKTIRKWWL